MKNVIKITVSELREMLLNWNFGAQPASIQYMTEPTLNAAGKKIFGTITKIASVGGMLGYCYENSVNNQLEREGKEREFLAQPLWNGKGKRLSLALSEHIEKGTFYMSYKPQQTFKSFHFDKCLNPISLDALKPYFPKNDYSKQGTDKPVYHREISLENIIRFKFKKTTYEVIKG